MKKLLTSLNDIEIIKESDNPSDLIGYGALSQVRKARLKSTGKMYAVKEMDLKAIHPNDIKNITREIKTHIYLDHPNIVKLYDNHTSPNQKLYLLLEYCDNNNLFHFIQKSRLDEKAVHKFFYQTVQGIEYIHKRKIMHRDLKPENILLDKNFNVKVCDFGWCAEYNENERRQTFCGTNEYMAPEILDKQRQDFGIDIWALGILLYEMYHKKAPFTGRSPHDIAKAIKRRKLVFSASPMCPEAKDIIDKILQMDPKKRLTIDQFYSHPYFHKYPFFRLVSDDSKTIIAKNSRRSYVGGEERNEIVNTLAKKSRAPSPSKANDVSTNGMNRTPVKITTIKENAYLMNDSKPMIHPSQIVTMTKITTPGGAPLVPTFTSPTPSNRLIQSDWNIQLPQPTQTFTPQVSSKSGMNSGMNSLNSSQISNVMNNGLSNTTTNYVPASTNTTAGTVPNMYSFSKQQTNMQINRESGRELQQSSRDIYSGIIISSDTERVHSNTVQFSKPIQLNGNQTYPSTNSYQPYKALQGTTYTPINYCKLCVIQLLHRTPHTQLLMVKQRASSSLDMALNEARPSQSI